MKRRIIRAILIVTLAIIAIFAVNRFLLGGDKSRSVSITSIQPEETNKNFKTIGIVVHNMQHLFMASVASMIRDKSKEYDNIKILLYDSEGRNDKQILQLEELIERKVDGIILNPNDKDLVNKGIEEVKKAGIPIITVNMNVSSELIDSYVGSDSVEAGVFQGKYIAQQLKGKGNVLILAGQKSHDAAADRLKGLVSILDQYPDLHIIEVAYGDWDRHRGLEIMKKVIEKSKKIDAIASQNDEMLLGALPVLQSFGLKPVTIGVDAIPEALESIKEGRMNATVYQNSRAQAMGAFDTMMNIFKGEKVDKIKWIPHELVTSGNIDEYINRNLGIR